MDYILVKVKNRQIKRYAAFCNKCGLSRGYKDKNKMDALCYKCNNAILNSKKIGQSKSIETKEKMSISALNRGNITKSKTVRVYKRKNSEQHVKIKSKVKSLLNSKIKNRFISKNRVTTFKILGYSIEEFKNNIESQFKPGMTWENHGKWHIDHIIPDSWFKYESFEDESFKMSWALSNLQPLWAKDNLQKNNHYSGSL